MFLDSLKRGFLAHPITLCFAITVTIGLLFVGTNTLIGDDAYGPMDPQSEEALALNTLSQPSGERRIAWGYVGAYSVSPAHKKRRIAFWEDNIDHFLSKAPDTEIANLASLFTEPNVIAILRQLVESNTSVADLAKETGIPESEVEKAVETLMKATLVERTDDNLIEPKNDAVSFFLNFVSMTIVHLGHTKSDR